MPLSPANRCLFDYRIMWSKQGLRPRCFLFLRVKNKRGSFRKAVPASISHCNLLLLLLLKIIMYIFALKQICCKCEPSPTFRSKPCESVATLPVAQVCCSSNSNILYQKKRGKKSTFFTSSGELPPPGENNINHTHEQKVSQV